MKNLGYPNCDMGHPTRPHGEHIDPAKHDPLHKPPSTVYRVRIDPKHEQVKAILVYIRCEEGPVVAGLQACQRLADIGPVVAAEHVTSVHQCRTGGEE